MHGTECTGIETSYIFYNFCPAQGNEICILFQFSCGIRECYQTKSLHTFCHARDMTIADAVVVAVVAFVVSARIKQQDSCVISRCQLLSSL